MNTEIEKFIQWCYSEINNNDMVALGPIRFVAEHKSHKNNTVTPIKWLRIMAKNMALQTNKGVTPADVAKEFNQIIDNDEIEPFITRSAKRIIKDATEEYMNDPEAFKEKYKDIPEVNKKSTQVPIDFTNESSIALAVAKSAVKYKELVSEAYDTPNELPSGEINENNGNLSQYE